MKNMNLEIDLPSGKIVITSMVFNEKTEEIDVEFTCVSGLEKKLKKELQVHFTEFLENSLKKLIKEE